MKILFWERLLNRQAPGLTSTFYPELLFPVGVVNQNRGGGIPWDLNL
jgi:hypothetical protein